jgi:hypothetical protein
MLQRKLAVSQPGDSYEQEADRVAEQVMRLPDTTLRLQRKCACGGSSSEKCDECASSNLQRKAVSDASPATPVSHAAHDLLRGTGQPLDLRTRTFMEARFGRDFGHVRVHTDTQANESARAVGALAFTLGRDLVFGAGQYAPETNAGKRLLAHELTHVVQQQSVAGAAHAASLGRATQGENVFVHEHLPETTLAGEWIIDNPNHQVSPTGKTDAELIGDAFGEICGLAQRNNDRISVAVGAPVTSNIEGCGCLSIIENDLASASPVQAGPPHIRMDVQGWSTTSIAPGFPARVGVRHPESTFGWGYWTGGQTRHLKPFWQTVAHEVCGHVAAFVSTRGANVGTRGVGQGHNIAIEGENRVAAEHGVTASEQRGLDMDPTGTPLPGHRGESFLQANVFDFAHASAILPASASQVISDTVSTISAGRRSSGLQMLVQVEGFALGNEGGSALAMLRATNVRLNIEAAMMAQNIPLTFQSGSGASQTTVNRFMSNLATVLPGTSTAASSNPGRRVHVYIFHQAHSAGP